ncbi:MAG: nucleoside deaminase [Candidatus Pacebacteria bacterium]|nr:nucleoside deaminase [Candidatus Paceibacterota bacterium]
MIHPNKEIMQRAINLAKEKHKEGGHAVAAIIIKNDKIIAEAFTTIDRDNDPICHAEINAIKLATKKLNSKKLEDCFLYSTFEPCPMCASAAIWARIKGIIYGASMNDETEKCPQRIKIKCSEVIKRGSPKLELYHDFMREECKELLFL